MRTAGQYQTGLFFLSTQARPVNVVTDVSADQGADAGAAGAVAAGAYEVDLGSLGGLQNGFVCICWELQVFRASIRLKSDGEDVGACGCGHGFSIGCRLDG